MPIPKKRNSETESEFLERCIPILINEGKSREQSVTICINQIDFKNISEFLKLKKIEEKKHTCVKNEKLENYLLNLKGEKLEDLLKEGWNITNIKQISNFKKEDFRVVSFPSLVSYLDTMTYKVRFRYNGPQDDKTRDFCRMMLNRNLLFRIEDIIDIDSVEENPDFDKYDVLTYKGSYGCRHNWEQLTLEREEPQIGVNVGGIILLN